jgi:hypothetical protein
MQSFTNFLPQGSGEVSAVLAEDVVSVQGLSVQKQAFGAVTSASDDFNGYPNSGLLGLAFSSISASQQPTFFENLIREKQVAAPVFSVHMTRGQETGSEVFISSFGLGRRWHLQAYLFFGFCRCALDA